MKLKNGFTKIPNFLLETILSYKCSGRQKELLFAIVRLTYGYHRESAEIALSLLSKMINQDKATVSKNINILVSKKVLLIKSEASFNKPRVISINLSINEWAGLSYNIEDLKENGVNKNSIGVIEKTTTATVDKITSMKEILKEINNDHDNLKFSNLKNIIIELYKYYCDKEPHPAEILKIQKEIPENFQEEQKLIQILKEAFQEFPTFEENKQNTRYLAGVIRKKINGYLSEKIKTEKKIERKKANYQSKNGDVKLNLLEQYDYLRKNKKQIIN